MKHLQATLIVTLLTLSLSNAAQAGARFPISHKGMVCIEHSDNDIAGAIAAAGARTEADLKSECELKLNGGGAMSVFKKIEVNYLNHGCPYGHQYNYTVEGDCVIP